MYSFLPSERSVSQDFCPWAGIATTLEALAKAENEMRFQDFCPWAGIATSIASAVAALITSPRISATGQAL